MSGILSLPGRRSSPAGMDPSVGFSSVDARGVFSFTFAGEPKAWSRARGYNHHTAPDLRDWQRRVREAADHAWGRPPMEGPIRVTIEAVFLAPKSGLHGQPTIRKPDADNLGKGILDALSTQAFRDDRQVAELVIRKLWGPAAETRVTIEELLEIPA